MKKFNKVLISLTISIIITAFILTISFISMLFSSGEEGFRTTYYDSIFFEYHETADEVGHLSFGVHKPWPIIITIICIFLFALIGMRFYSDLTNRKEELQSGEKPDEL